MIFLTEGYLVFNIYFNLIVQKFRGVMKAQIGLLRSHLTTRSPSGRGPSLCWAIRLVGLVLTISLSSHQESNFPSLALRHTTQMYPSDFSSTIFGHIHLYFDILYEPMSYKSTIANMISSLIIHPFEYQKIHVSLIVIRSMLVHY